MQHANRMKVVNFQPSWDALNWYQYVKSKKSFFSGIPKYLKKEKTWRVHFYPGLLMCKSRANLNFQFLPDYIWFLWPFALKYVLRKHWMGWNFSSSIEINFAWQSCDNNHVNSEQFLAGYKAQKNTNGIGSLKGGDALLKKLLTSLFLFKFIQG